MTPRKRHCLISCCIPERKGNISIKILQVRKLPIYPIEHLALVNRIGRLHGQDIHLPSKQLVSGHNGCHRIRKTFRQLQGKLVQTMVRSVHIEGRRKWMMQQMALAVICQHPQDSTSHSIRVNIQKPACDLADCFLATQSLRSNSAIR